MLRLNISKNDAEELFQNMKCIDNKILVNYCHGGGALELVAERRSEIIANFVYDDEGHVDIEIYSPNWAEKIINFYLENLRKGQKFKQKP